MTGPQLRRQRDARKLTRFQLAALLLVPESTVRQWESGTRRIPALAVQLIRQVLAEIPDAAEGDTQPSHR